jgi:molybdate transport system substrate-binding protein
MQIMRWIIGGIMNNKLSVATLILGLSLPASADAAEIKVASTGNMQTILRQVTPDFERASGHKLVIEYGSTPRTKARVESGDPVDLTINERYVLDELARQGRIVSGTLVDVARSPFAIGVRAGAPKPDVSTLDTLKRALLAADSIAQPDHTGGAQDGAFFVSLIAQLGITDQMKPKIKITQGGDNAAKLVADGGAQMGVAQRRNFLSLPGVAMLEPLPDAPGFKFLMVAGVVAGAHEREGALAFARYLASPERVGVITANGMEPYN